MKMREFAVINGGMTRAMCTGMSLLKHLASPPSSLPRRMILLGVGLASCMCLASGAWAAPKAPAGQGLSSSVIQKTIRGKHPEFRQCYDDLDDQPPLRVEMHFTIGSDGKVSAGYAESVVRPAMVPCVERAMFSLVFPRPSGGDVAVVYSLDFAP